MTAYDTILNALGDTGVKVVARGNGARAQCPVHNSTGLTLSVQRLEDRARVTCFAGCDTPDVLDAIGLALRDLYDDQAKTSRAYRPSPPPSPLGDLDHFFHRVEQQARAEAAPGYAAKRAAEIEDARRPRPGDHPGGPVAPW